MAYRKNKVAGWFGLGSASQAVVIFAYLLLNLLIVLLGGAEPSVLIMPNTQLTALTADGAMDYRGTQLRVAGARRVR